jgi:hypothetical protein
MQLSASKHTAYLLELQLTAAYNSKSPAVYTISKVLAYMLT